MFLSSAAIGVGTLVGNDGDWPEMSMLTPKWHKIMGQHFFHLSIPANAHQLKQISKTISEYRENAARGLGFGLLMFIQLTNQTNMGGAWGLK